MVLSAQSTTKGYIRAKCDTQRKVRVRHDRDGSWGVGGGRLGAGGGGDRGRRVAERDDRMRADMRDRKT